MTCRHPRLAQSTVRAALGLLLVLAASVGASDEVQRQIDRELWIPFLAASNAFDAGGFLAVQSKDMVRVSPDSGEVYGLARYQSEIREGFARARERGLVRRSEMRFLERTASDELAYETGYFRTEAALPTGQVRVRYTRFEMLLRKENGKWKILVDKDSARGEAIGEETFLSAAPMMETGR